MPDLIVGRDRAHVRELLRAYPHSEVVSAGGFFENIRGLAFLEHPQVRLAPSRPMVLAHQWLAENQNHPVYLASSYANLFNSFFHGVCPPSLAKAKMAEENHKNPVIDALAFMELAMEKESLVTKASSLFLAMLALPKAGLPHFLKRMEVVRFWHLVDLTLLEIHVIKMLGHLGLAIEINLPLDFQARGINSAVDFIAKQFEKTGEHSNIELHFTDIATPGPLKGLTEGLFDVDAKVTVSGDHCHMGESTTLLDEAHAVAAQISALSLKAPAPKIAVAVRTLDSRSQIYQRVLQKYGLAVKDPKGDKLSDTEAGLLLASLFALRVGVNKSELLAFLRHPLMAMTPRPCPDRCARLLEELGINDAVSLKIAAQHYPERIDRFLQYLAPEDEAFQAAATLREFVVNLFKLLAFIKDTDDFFGFASALKHILSVTLISDEAPAAIALKAELDRLLSDLKPDGFCFSAPNFFLTIIKLLQSQTTPGADEDDPHAVELLLLPEVLGRKFDHIFLVDMNFGRLPKTMAQDPIFNDAERILLNQVMKRPVLRIYLEDPYEPMPVPARQALEPFWFAASVACATQKVWFSRAFYDHLGQEEVPSEFFMWLKGHVSVLPSTEALPVKYCSHEIKRLVEGQRDQALAKTTGERPFYFGADKIAQALDGRLGPKATRTITPTFIEGFAQCRFKGLADRVLLADPESGDEDLDIRLVGQIAHKALELFFAAPPQDPQFSETLALIDRLVDEAITAQTQSHYIADLDLLFCQSEWLKSALVKLVWQLHPGLPNETHKITREIAFGLGRHGFPAVKITVENQTFNIGGIIDRVDQIGQKTCVIDYKLSSVASLKARTHMSVLMESQFQLPIYLRLVADLMSPAATEITFALASIKDGEIVEGPDFAAHPDLLHRILDDNHPQSMARKIHEILQPLGAGEARPTPGEHCQMCAHQFFCRKGEL